MINNQYPNYLNIYISKHPLFLVILCFSLISCTTPQKKHQDEIKQTQSEQKPLVVHEKNKIAGDKIEQPDTSSVVKNGNENKLPQNPKQKTNANNYSSEIKNTQTSGEKATKLEDKLNTSLREFDELLLKKNEELSLPSRREESQGGNGLTSQGQGQGEAKYNQDENSGDPSTASGASGQKNAGTMSQNKEFDNDDVVARQIREAAEKETDPELKKKLWEEYRKYKAGSN